MLKKKSSHRILVEIARAIAQIGYPVLMVDLRGCGDSSGVFATVRLDEWLEDIDKSINQFYKEVAINQISIIGLRFGAYLSLCYTEYKKSLNDLIWIEPVLFPIDYLKKSLRNKLMKELYTEGNITSNRNNLLNKLEENNNIDFDGYELNSKLYLDLVNKQENQLLYNLLPTLPIKLLLCISMNRKLSKSYRRIPIVAPHIRIETITMELFWNKADDVESKVLINYISNYINEEYTYE